MKEIEIKNKSTKLIRNKNIYTVDELLEIIFIKYSENILYNYKLMHDNYNSESLHRFRISLRKFKSFIFFFKNEINKKERKVAKNFINELLAPTSKMRDFDIALEYFILPYIYKNPGDHELISLKSYAEKSQAQIHENTLKNISSKKYQILMKKLITWVNDREWRIKLTKIKINKLNKKPKNFIKNKANKQYNIIIKEKENVLIYTQTELHKYRTSVKILRYIIDDLQIIIKNKISELELLKRLQDTLGKINDTYVASQIIDELSQHVEIDHAKHCIYDNIDKLREKYLHELKNIK